MTIKDITGCFEDFAPLAFQESFDNCGLLIGDESREIEKVLFTLDYTDEVLDEAIQKKCGLVISHHPLIFHGLKKLSGKDPVQRLAVKSIKSDVSVYAMHTNLDNSLFGLNRFVCEKLELVRCSVLSPARGKLSKLVTFVPASHAGKVRDALFEAGAGHIGNYDCCSYNSNGSGSFRASEKANPFVGEKNVIHFEEELRIEMIFPSFLEQRLVSTLKSNHPYEEVAFDIYSLENFIPSFGSGMIGELEKEMDAEQFLDKVKSLVQIPVVRHSRFTGRSVRKVAVCTGAGSFLIEDAVRSGADIFLSADLKYHDFFAVDGRLILADIGHFESEQFAKELLADILIRKFPTFAFHISEVDTNPIQYH